MQNGISKRWQIGALLLVCVLALASCGGGGSSSPDPTPNPGNNPGGAQGNIGNGINLPVDPADVPQPEAIALSFDDAPLGVNPAYNVGLGGAEIVSHGASKAGSELGAGESFTINWVTVCGDGETPNHEDNENLSFAEGQSVDLWLEYEVAPNTEVERSWDCNAAGLEFTEVATHTDGGVYQARLDYIIPFGSADEEASLNVFLQSPRTGSVIVIGDNTSSATVKFAITDVETQDPINYPGDPDDENDEQGGGGGCIPDIQVTFNGTSINVVSTKDLSNVVLEFQGGARQKFDDLKQGPTGTFQGTGGNSGKTITRAWIKSGCNQSGDGPGYGERFAPTYEALGMAQMCWEDLIVNSDYDYNDFVGRLRATEIRNENNELVQIQLTVKAVARGAGYNADWQFNIDAAFPGADVIAVVDQYYANGQRHGGQRIWTSENGASVPIFSPTRDALPNPPDHSFATNVVAGTTFMDGDFAEVTILFSQPLAQGTYTPIPYEPELKVYANGDNVYSIGLWRNPGDDVDSNGRPLAFIVPDTYSWPLESKRIWNVFPGFNAWITWINNPGGNPPSPNWWDTVPVGNEFQRSLFH